jgi:hypothetical protein
MDIEAPNASAVPPDGAKFLFLAWVSVDPPPPDSAIETASDAARFGGNPQLTPIMIA